MKNLLTNRINFETQVLREAEELNPYHTQISKLAITALEQGWFESSNLITSDQFKALQDSTGATENQVRQVMQKMENIVRSDPYTGVPACFFNSYKMLVLPRPEKVAAPVFNEAEYI